jgi:hypothetical protein
MTAITDGPERRAWPLNATRDPRDNRPLEDLRQDPFHCGRNTAHDPRFSGNVIHSLALWRQAAGTCPDWAPDFRARSNAAILAGDTAALTSLAPTDRAAQLAVNSGEHFLPPRREGDDVALFNDTLDGALSMTSVLVGDTSLLKILV